MKNIDLLPGSSQVVNITSDVTEVVVRHCVNEDTQTLSINSRNPAHAWLALGEWCMEHQEDRVWSAHAVFVQDDSTWDVVAYYTEG